jgi:hypothetical protein
MAALKDSVYNSYDDHATPNPSSSGWTDGEYTFVPFYTFEYPGFFSEVDLTEFMDKLLEIEERLNSWSCGEIGVEDDTPSAGYVTLKYYTDEATPTLYKTIVVNKTTGARSQAT